MISNKIISVTTSQDSAAFLCVHTSHSHPGGNTVTTTVRFPKSAAHSEGFPVGYHVSVTPSHACSVHVSDQTPESFDVTLTSLDARPLAEGTFTVLVIG
jgi:hypothetical protein